MPSSATITSFNSFIANTRARATQVNTNFSVFRGHFIPIDPNTATAANATYDLGSTEWKWRAGHFSANLNVDGTISAKTIQFKNVTTAGLYIESNLSGTGMNFIVNNATSGSLNTNGFSRVAQEYTETSGVNDNTSTTWTTVFTLSLTSAYGSPIFVGFKAGFVSGTTGSDNVFEINNGYFTINVLRDASTINSSKIFGSGGLTTNTYYIGGSMNFFDQSPGAGAHTYKVEIIDSSAGSAGNVFVRNMKMYTWWIG